MIRDLGGGLILRAGTPDDTDALVAWAAEAFREEDGSPDRPLLAWIRDLQVRHPTFSPELWRVVAEAATGRIVSGLCLIPQTWRFEGLDLPVGLVEIVGTLPEFRKRGLVGALMDEIHAVSAGRGDLVQAISGIPWFYRRFGYEMALPMHGGRRLAVAEAPEPRHPGEAAFAFRPATVGDAAFLADVTAAASERYLVTCPRNRDLWVSELTGHSDGSAARRVIEIMERAGVPVGTVGWHPDAWERSLWGAHSEVAAGVSWGEAGPAVLRRLAAAARESGASAVTLAFGDAHPLFDAMWHVLGERVRPYAWYLRAADIPALLRHIAPVLERRLDDGPFEGHTGSVKVSWYRSGVRFLLDGGLLTVEDWSPDDRHRGDVAFPGLTFLSLVFGHRSIRDLRDTHPDCAYWTPSAAPLLDAMFPQRPSSVWSVA